MPARLHQSTESSITSLQALGREIRARRKNLGVSAMVAAQTAGMSRITWHRIENGEGSVTMGAYVSAAQALGLSLHLADPTQAKDQVPANRNDWIPVRIRLADYPALRQLAWHVQGVDSLTPREALDIYERNEPRWNIETLSPAEAQLIAALRQALSN